MTPKQAQSRGKNNESVDEDDGREYAKGGAIDRVRQWIDKPKEDGRDC